MKSNGLLVISLDFELLWGVFDVFHIHSKSNYFSNTRAVIPTILKEFEKYQIHATWAIVGMLFNENWADWEQNVPESEPTYINDKLSAYNFGRKINSSNKEKLCFAPELIEQISKVSGQEIGTHTYSHYYCMEKGQTVEQFRLDLEQAIHVASRKNIKLTSLVFPRNQLKEEYLEVCWELGIKTVRSNPDDWYWRDPSSEKLSTKIFRTGEAYNIFGGRKSYAMEEILLKNNLPLSQRASRFLRPYEDNKLLQELKLRKIKKEISLAAKKKEVYHLWWHPHNFGERPDESLEELSEILKHFSYCREKYNLQSLNMQELAERRNRVKVS